MKHAPRVALAVAGSILALASFALSETTSSAPVDKEWRIVGGIGGIKREIVPAGEIVFFGSFVEIEQGRHYKTFFQLDTKTGACTDVASFLADVEDPQQVRISSIQVAPDAKHAILIAKTVPSFGPGSGPPKTTETIYLLEVGKATAKPLEGYVKMPDGPGNMFATWCGKDSFFIFGVDEQRKLAKPVQFNTAGKKIGDLCVYAFLLYISDDQKTVIVLADPDKLTGPAEVRAMEKTAKLLVLKDGKVVQTIDALPASSVSNDGKLFACRLRKPPTSQPTTSETETGWSIFSIDGKKVTTITELASLIHISNSGDSLGIKLNPQNIGGGGPLTRWSADGQEKVLLEGVRTAAVSGETLYYILSDQEDVMKSVALSKLK